ncbi:hypothetical protein EVG20_g9200 [Dentipellis fragilis]|uniref:Membrane anchor Opy2 N-terminal domain-containing protein n=1 Tax=Dentipellis fragilis TaxID=205917 RepID=A0A4Y9Y093_9AGAM|nr:hypothetical protein EVG20_g9200 [Dentipellis fragilis]
MHLDHLLYPRQNDGCIQCPDPPACNCGANQHCFQTSRSCTVCSTFTCVNNTSSSKSSSGPSGGAVAGAVIGCLIFLGLVVAAFFWWRRRQAARAPAAEPATKEIPAPAETVLNRPDPNEKPVPPPRPDEQLGTVRVFSTNSNSIIDLDPERSDSGAGSTYNGERQSVQSNPFVDGQSILTTSTMTQSTNVIPIAFVPPGSVGSMSPHSPPVSLPSTNGPVRPARSPDVGLNMDHLGVSNDSISRGAPSMRSDISGTSSRQSYMSGASYASDMLSEDPTIVTQSQRQVVGVVKAEVIQAPGSAPSTPRPAIRSPLAASSFGPQDVLREVDETQELTHNGDPFGDQHTPDIDGNRTSMATMATNTEVGSVWTPQAPSWQHNEDISSRPASVFTQAASIIGADIRDATRVHLGFVQPTSASIVPSTPVSSSGMNTPRSPYRMTSAKLVSPSASRMNPLERMQERAYADVQARQQQQSFDASQRMSMSTVASGASRADSILESFTFVPPSPISNRPARSPLSKEKPVTSDSSSGQYQSDADSPLPAPRRIQGLSTGSQLSAMSTGLGSFPFQIDHGTSQQEEAPAPTNSLQGRQRASLDTLALTSDLSSYPLKFDLPPPKDGFTRR